MYKITFSQFDNIPSIEVTNKSKGVHLQILSGFGGIINRFYHQNSTFSYIEGYSSANSLRNTFTNYSRSAKLFPFPNRLNKGNYFFQGEHYQLNANFPWSDHAVHGLVYDQPFEVIDHHCDEQSAQVTLSYEPSQPPRGYPFRYRIRIIYTLQQNGKLTCKTEIENLDNCPLPFGDGWHPYFSLGKPLNECRLTMPSTQELLNDSDGLPNGKYANENRFVQPKLLDELELNHCYLIPENQSIFNVYLTTDNSPHGLHFWQQSDSSGYRYLQLYTPPERESIAIEPMTCPADAFNNKQGLRCLLPSEKIQLVWGCQPVNLI